MTRSSESPEPSRNRRIISAVITALFVVALSALIRWRSQPGPPPNIPVDPNRPIPAVVPGQ